MASIVLAVVTRGGAIVGTGAEQASTVTLIRLKAISRITAARYHMQSKSVFLIPYSSSTSGRRKAAIIRAICDDRGGCRRAI